VSNKDVQSGPKSKHFQVIKNVLNRINVCQWD